MRALLLSTVAAAGLLGAAPAAATDITLGRSLASACFESSFSSVPQRFAVRECDRALEDELLSERDRAATFVNRGIIKMSSGDLRGADGDFDTAIGLNSSDPEALLNKGLLRLRENKVDEAIAFIDRAIEARTMRPALAYYARGISNEQMGNVRAAYADLVRARDLDPRWDLPAKELTRYRVMR